MPLSDIVNITISRDAPTVSQAAFGVENICGPNLKGDSKILYFNTNDLSEVASALTGGTDAPEYKAALSIASQSPAPRTFAISRKDGNEDYDEALAAIKLIDNDWYGLTITSRTAADVLLAAKWAEANKKVFWTASSASRIIDTAFSTDDGKDEETDSIAAILKARSYVRSYSLYHGSADTEFPEAGFLGSLLARQPGSYTGMFKNIVGIGTSSLTPTNSKNALDKNCNIYQLISGISMVRESTSGQGEFFDIIHFIDWIVSRLGEAVFGYLAKLDKVPFTSEGLVGLKSVMDQIGQLGISVGGFSPISYNEDGTQIGGFSCTVPRIEDVLDADRSARKLTGVKFRGFLAGAIHAVEMVANITV